MLYITTLFYKCQYGRILFYYFGLFFLPDCKPLSEIGTALGGGKSAARLLLQTTELLPHQCYPPLLQSLTRQLPPQEAYGKSAACSFNAKEFTQSLRHFKKCRLPQHLRRRQDVLTFNFALSTLPPE